MLNHQTHFQGLEPGTMDRRDQQRVPAAVRVEFRVMDDSEGVEAVAEMEKSNLQVLAALKKQGEPENPVKVESLDVSLQGLRIGGDIQILAERQLEKGCFLDMEVTLPLNGFVVRLIGLVAWSKHLDSGSFESGVSIFAIAEEDRLHYKEFVEKAASK